MRFTYVEVPEHNLDHGYCSAAREAHSSAVRELGLAGREPAMRFFCRESAWDREAPAWAQRERLHSDLAIAGRAYPDRNGGRGEIWISTECSSEQVLKRVVLHEVRHVWQGMCIDDMTLEEHERDADGYARKDRDFLTELLGR